MENFDVSSESEDRNPIEDLQMSKELSKSHKDYLLSQRNIDSMPTTPVVQPNLERLISDV